MNQASVSVIIPHYNASATIARSLASVAEQTLGVQEVIVVDDCSDDFVQLSDIVARWPGNCPIRLLRLPVNAGASEARNHGAACASGTYLAFLDADDVWRSDKIELQYGVMERERLHLSGHLYVSDLHTQSMEQSAALHTRTITASRFALGNPFFTPTIMVRRLGFAPFDRRYRRVDDYKCWLMNIRLGGNALILVPLAGGFKRAIGQSGLTSSFKVMHEAYVVVLRDLYQEKHIGLGFYSAARLIEAIKYPLRILKGLRRV